MKLNLTLRISILALFVVCCAWRLSHAQDPPNRIEIVAKRWEFTPSEITLKKGEPVILVLTSKDVAARFETRGIQPGCHSQERREQPGRVHPGRGRHIFRAMRGAFAEQGTDP